METINIDVETLNGTEAKAIEVTDLVIAGWAGRDAEAMEHHIRELEALGIARPRETPIFYRVSASRLATEDAIEVMGDDSSGEVECVLTSHNGKLFVGIGSDHTDRKVETFGVTASKQICEKPVSTVFWPFDEVSDHWDELVITSYATIGGERVLYQNGPVAGLLRPETLIKKYTDGGTLPDGTMMFCGTLPAIGGIRSASDFECRLVDPVLARELELRYHIKSLAIAD
ncbi:DUF2848 domain-containing protein [Hwanghaeella grinnelliae]|uniref:DUF2848 domain-containing protein n=1 Tax=Hwanghaeella grinnelliae TaxID=2500179 RepID=A0A437QQV3_9PROT|nr:DUF2848 domain-containing protein [Hwanghaeella grinnelliae]RVU36847.1 DUF2848 domain-containing protein [Hwanghaeella grinnelliae]